MSGFISCNGCYQKRISTKMTATIDKVKIMFEGSEVIAHKLTVVSEIHIDIDTAWEKVKTYSLLEFISKGKVKFKRQATEGRFPELWKEKETVKMRMLIFGLLPFGGLHIIYFDKIDDESKTMQTSEHDNIVKVWKHNISMHRASNHTIHYTDEVIIYSGALTGIISWWAKSFYKHRQKRWQLITDKK